MNTKLRGFEMSPEFAKKINDVEYAKLAPFRAALAEEKMLQNQN